MQAECRIGNNSLAVGLSLRGGALTGGWTVDGQAFLHPGGEGGRACFPMVPLCNRVAGNGFAFGGRDWRLKPNAADPLYLHGDGWLAEWQAVALQDDRARLAFCHDTGPFRYRAEQEIALNRNSLFLRLSVQNEGAEPMPFGLGFHPYFPREGAKVTFTATARWTEGPGHLPGERQTTIPDEVDFSHPQPLPLAGQNNAYEGWSGRARIDWTDMALDLTPDPLFDALMLYAPLSDRGFFCLEPMSHLPDALNRPHQPGLRILAPGATLSGTMTMTITQRGRRP